MEMQFTIGQSVEFAFEMGGGGVSPSPEPGSSGGIITGVPVAVAIGAMGAAALTGDVEEE